MHSRPVDRPLRIVGRAGSPRFGMAQRCSGCGRYVYASHAPRTDGAGRWHHETCDDLAAPTDAEVTALAEVLVSLSGCRRATQLRDRALRAKAELASLAVLQRLQTLRGEPDQLAAHRVARQAAAVEVEWDALVRERAELLREDWERGRS